VAATRAATPTSSPFRAARAETARVRPSIWQPTGWPEGTVARAPSDEFDRAAGNGRTYSAAGMTPVSDLRSGVLPKVTDSLHAWISIFDTSSWPLRRRHSGR